MVQTDARPRGVLIAMIAFAMSGCSGSASAPTPVNLAPNITSAATASFPENGTGIAYQASATDPEGAPVTLSLSGTDAARLTINATGEVRFASSPNFEKPTDADGNNVYTFELLASDGKASASQTVTITVTNSAEGIAVQRVATGFVRPTAIVAVPGTGGLIVAERSGAIYRLDPATQQRTLLATVAGLTTAPDQGLLAIAVPPDFATRDTLYTMVAHANGTIALRQIYSGGRGWAEFPIGRPLIFSTDLGGWLGFGPDGRLYIAAGDPEGSSYAQDPTSLFSKLFVLSSLNFDPYAGATVAPPITPTLLASGLHRPVGGAFFAGGLLLPDRGRIRNEVNLLPLAPGGFDNLGWPYQEGTYLLSSNVPANLVAPVLEYAVGTGVNAGQTIVGGFPYRGGNASLTGAYVFADASGAIWTVPLASLQRGTTLTPAAFERRELDFVPTSGVIAQPVGIVQDASGAIYIACDNGDVFRAIAS